jgi:hypothetical protein
VIPFNLEEKGATNDLASIPLTMSSLEISGLTGKRHGHVIDDTRKMLVGLGYQPTEFSVGYIDLQGKKRECFNLAKRETLILVSGYDARSKRSGRQFSACVDSDPFERERFAASVIASSAGLIIPQAAQRLRTGGRRGLKSNATAHFR